MSDVSVAADRLAAVAQLKLLRNEPLAAYTRFGIGGPAALLGDTSDAQAFTRAIAILKNLAVPRLIVGGGTNLVVSDAGYDGVILRFTGSTILRDDLRLTVESGAVLQDVVDYSVAAGLKGMQTLTGIPGYLGGAVYGNAGAYGHSMHELVERVRFTDGEQVREFDNAACVFSYRESIFKDQKDWIILSTTLRFSEGDPAELKQAADDIRAIRDAKYPPTMKCAGSIFKNVFFADIPAAAQRDVPPKMIRDGKIPSAWFLEQVDAKGIRRGDIQVATYHANLIYNDGDGKSADLVVIIEELKQRVRARFGFDLEEEVQYVGFEYSAEPA